MAIPASLQDLIERHLAYERALNRHLPPLVVTLPSLLLSMLHDRDTSFALVSRAPLSKLEAYKARRGWNLPWFSSYETDFNYDFHVTFDESVTPIEYNFRSKAEYEHMGTPFAVEQPSEAHGLSVFFRLDDAVFHTYSAYARGVEGLTDAYSLLDVTPYGRQEDWEDSPPGWPQRPTYGS